MVRRVLAGTLTAAVAAAGLVLAQDRVEFRSRADLVSVFITVTDAQGELVSGLTEHDFAVFDEGRKQPITVFSSDAQPVSVIVMLDRSGSMAEEFDQVRDAASEFVRKLLPQDRARIGDFADEIHLAPAEFTGDQPELLRILREDLQSVGPSPVWTAVDRSITALLKAPGRRVVLLFSDGVDQPRFGQIKTDVKDLMYRARYDEIMVYTIGVPTSVPTVQHGFGANRGRIGSTTSIVSKPLKPDPDLARLAAESGGGYFELTPYRSMSSVFTRIADELHRQYWLGFSAGRLDGKTHKLEVKVLRPGLTARARKSYVADAGR
jgi:Ca-activated chloride channel family protein